MYPETALVSRLAKEYKNDYLFRKYSGWYVMKSSGYALNMRPTGDGEGFVLGMVTGIRFVPGMTAVPISLSPDMDMHMVQDQAVKTFLASKNKIRPMDEEDRRDFERGIRQLEARIRKFYDKKGIPLPGGTAQA